MTFTADKGSQLALTSTTKASVMSLIKRPGLLKNAGRFALRLSEGILFRESKLARVALQKGSHLQR